MRILVRIGVGLVFSLYIPNGVARVPCCAIFFNVYIYVYIYIICRHQGATVSNTDSNCRAVLVSVHLYTSITSTTSTKKEQN